MDIQELDRLIEESFGIRPEHIFKTDETISVYRHPDGGKWFALYMVIPSSKLGLFPDHPLGIVNVKCDPAFIGSILRKHGIYPAWHMNKNHWISIALEFQNEPEEVRFLIEQSYLLTAPKAKGHKHMDL